MLKKELIPIYPHPFTKRTSLAHVQFTVHYKFIQMLLSRINSELRTLQTAMLKYNTDLRRLIKGLSEWFNSAPPPNNYDI